MHLIYHVLESIILQSVYLPGRHIPLLNRVPLAAHLVITCVYVRVRSARFMLLH